MAQFDQRSFELGSRIGADAFHKKQAQDERNLRYLHDQAMKREDNEAIVKYRNEIAKATGVPETAEKFRVETFGGTRELKELSNKKFDMTPSERKALETRGSEASGILSGLIKQQAPETGQRSIESSRVTPIDKDLARFKKTDLEVKHERPVLGDDVGAVDFTYDPDRQKAGFDYQTALRKKELAEFKLSDTEEYISKLSGKEAEDYFNSPKFDKRQADVSAFMEETARARTFAELPKKEVDKKILKTQEEKRRNAPYNATVEEFNKDLEEIGSGTGQQQRDFVLKYGQQLLDRSGDNINMQRKAFNKIRTAHNNIRTYYGKDERVLTPADFGLDFRAKKTGKGKAEKFDWVVGTIDVPGQEPERRSIKVPHSSTVEEVLAKKGLTTPDRASWFPAKYRGAETGFDKLQKIIGSQKAKILRNEVSKAQLATNTVGYNSEGAIRDAMNVLVGRYRELKFKMVEGNIDYVPRVFGNGSELTSKTLANGKKKYVLKPVVGKSRPVTLAEVNRLIKEQDELESRIAGQRED